MISDALAEALEEIRDYQRERPHYAHQAPAINAACEVMEALCRYFDTPPLPPLNDALDELKKAIANIDLSAMRAARDNLYECRRAAGSASKK